MIRTKLIIWNSVILTLLLAVIGAAIYWMTRQSMLNAVDAALRARAGFYKRVWRGPMTEDQIRRARERLPQVAALEAAGAEGVSPEEIRALRVQRLASQTIHFGLDGVGIVDPEERPRSMAGFQAALQGRSEIHSTKLGGEPARTIFLPLEENGDIVQIAEFSASLTPTFAELERLEGTLMLVLPLAVGVMVIAGIFLTKRALAPVAQISEAAGRIGGENLEERLPVTGKDEFAQLSDTFNTMLGRIEEAFKTQEESFQRQKAFTADASHELKTPLTAIRTRAEIALRRDLAPAKYKEHLQAIDRAAKAMSRLVQDLLLLAKSDEGRSQLAYESTPVAELVQEALDSVDPHDRHVHVKVPEGMRVTGNRGALTRVLTNLLENSVRHTAETGRIELSAVQYDSKVDISIQDDGEGIPEEDLPRIFDRFHRVDRSRNRDSGGTGLGLAIAKAIVEAHGGQIGIRSELNKGTAVTVTLPVR